MVCVSLCVCVCLRFVFDVLARCVKYRVTRYGALCVFVVVCVFLCLCGAFAIYCVLLGGMCVLCDVWFCVLCAA